MEGHASVNSITLTMWKLEDLPTHQVFSTNEPWEGGLRERGLAPAAPAQRHPSGHLIEHPVQVTSGRAQIPRGWGAPREAARRARERSRTGQRGPARGLTNQGSDTPASIHVPAALGRSSHPVQKTNSHHSLSSQVPLATTSDLKQKHSSSLLNPRKKEGLPEVTKKWRTEDEAEAPAAGPPRVVTASPRLFASEQLQNGKAWKQDSGALHSSCFLCL